MRNERVRGDRVAKINDFVESSLVSNVSKVHLDKSRDTYIPHSDHIPLRYVVDLLHVESNMFVSFVSLGIK